MAYSYHPNAKTTIKIRKEIKNCKLSVEEAAKKFNVSTTTIRKWKRREDLADRSHATGVKSYTLSELERYIICEIKKTTLFSIDDILQLVKDFMPNANRSNIYRTLRQENLNRNSLILPLEETTKEAPKEFKHYEPGYIHVDIKDLPKINGIKKYLFIAIDRNTRLSIFKVYDEKTSENATDFLDNIIKRFPFKITKILTDNGKQFTDRFRINGDNKPTGKHIFDQRCKKYNIEHRLTRPYTPKTNGMVERMNGRVKENILDKFHFKNYDDLIITLYRYQYQYNYFIRQKKLDFLSPVEYIKQKYKNFEINDEMLNEQLLLYNQAKLDK